MGELVDPFWDDWLPDHLAALATSSIIGSKYLVYRVKTPGVGMRSKLDHFSSAYFIGIGGAGMSALARILVDMKVKVAGSDLKASRNTARLEQFGAKIFIGHRAQNLDNADIVVISSAIPPNNPELLAARERGIPVIKRAELLAWILNRAFGIAVAGTHGKTTTTSMISLIAEICDLKPTILIGGELNDIGSNAKRGSGEIVIAEVDESDGTLIYMRPKIAVITNIDEDHLDYFQNIEEIRELFRRYIVCLPDDGLVVACGDCPTLGPLVRETGRRCVTYGLQDGNGVRAENIVLFEFGSKFRVTLDGQEICQITLNIPGVHNIYNALAAISVANHLQLPLERVSAILANFCGAQRRFELKGKANGITVVDDYAHHPTEIRATLAAARTGAVERIVSIFQPHRYSRTKKLANSFGRSFGDSDLTIITDVYGAGEDPIPGVSGKTILDSLLSFSPRTQVAYLPRTRTIVDYLLETVKDGDLVLTMGAGDIWTVAEDLVKRLCSLPD